MSEAFQSIAEGLHEAIALSGEQAVHAGKYCYEAIDVGKLGLAESEFAAIFCARLSTLGHWECIDRKPHGSALA